MQKVPTWFLTTIQNSIHVFIKIKFIAMAVNIKFYCLTFVLKFTNKKQPTID